MFTNNENRARLHDAIDKGIVHTVRPNARAMPPGLLGATPLNSNPNGAPVPPSAAADTRAARELGPLTPSPALRPIPPGAKISPNVTAALPRQADGVEQRVHDFLKRKYK
jgi:hypothetical protein